VGWKLEQRKAQQVALSAHAPEHSAILEREEHRDGSVEPVCGIEAAVDLV
jgi:hypothetical protein